MAGGEGAVMTATLDGETKKKEPAEQSAEQQAATELCGWPESRAVSDRSGRVAQAADQDGDRDRVERGDDSARGL
jgi:hypothetical protein